MAAQLSPGTNGGEETLSPLEQQVLDEYAQLAGNLEDVCVLSYVQFIPYSTCFFHIVCVPITLDIYSPTSLPSISYLYTPPLLNTTLKYAPLPH